MRFESLCSMRCDRGYRPRCWCQSAQPTRAWVANSVCQLPANSVNKCYFGMHLTAAISVCETASSGLRVGIAPVWTHALEALALSPAGVRAFSGAHALRPLARARALVWTHALDALALSPAGVRAFSWAHALRPLSRARSAAISACVARQCGLTH